MQVAAEISSRLLHVLYLAMLQVASPAMGAVLLATTVWWRVHSVWTAGLIIAAATAAIIWLSILFAYRRKNGDIPAPLAEAIFLERFCGTFAIVMAFVLGTCCPS